LVVSKEVNEVSERLLVTNNLTKVFKVGTFRPFEIRAVDGLNMDIKENEIVSLIGESGSGKTTVGRMVLRFVKPTGGEMFYKGKNVMRIRGKEVKWYYKEVQGIFQDPYASFNPVHRLNDILDSTLKSFFPNMDDEERQKAIVQALEEVGLNSTDVLRKYPHEVSGGQLQRVSIARALLTKPKLLIADEPVSMLDASTRIDILNILLDLTEKEKTSILLIGHDLSLAYYISDRVLVLYRGDLVEAGDVRDVFENPLHPYTQMLIKAVPRVEEKWAGEYKFKAEAEERSLYYMRGCKYTPRCPFAMQTCSMKPKLTVEGNGHYVACWLYGKK
jgi:peptide/nickel transport system ATP-binding protein